MFAMVDMHDIDWWPPERPGRKPDPSVCRSVHGAYHALARRLQWAMRDHGLGTSEAMVLAFLLSNNGCAAAVIRHGLGLHRSTLSSLLDRLEALGLIVRTRSAFDGRRLEVDLTSLGTIAAEIATAVIRDVEAELAEFTSPGQRRGADAVFAACLAITRSDGVMDR
jgi:DNA-binding MarR family transcriptional regulator